MILSYHPAYSFQILFLPRPLCVEYKDFFRVFMAVVRADLVRQFVYHVNLRVLSLYPRSYSSVQVEVSQRSSPNYSCSNGVRLFGACVATGLGGSDLFRYLNGYGLYPSIFYLYFFAMGLTRYFCKVYSTFYRFFQQVFMSQLVRVVYGLVRHGGALPRGQVLPNQEARLYYCYYTIDLCGFFCQVYYLFHGYFLFILRIEV